MTVPVVPSAQPAFPCGRNQQGSAMTAALLFLGVFADLWLGTSQCSAQREAASYLTAGSQSAGAAAEQAAELKSLRYDELSSDQLRAASLIGRNAVT